MYKLTTLPELELVSGISKGNTFIPIDEGNTDYQQFIQDVAEQGIGIVEGPDVVEPSYAELRAQEYPSYADQFDKIYHEGVDAWKEEIQKIKDKHPKTITGGTTIGAVPNWVQEAADNWTHNKQLREYVTAVERLEVDAVVASDAIPATIEIDAITETMEPTKKTIRNPVIVKDEEERAAAQAVIDATPQSVIDSLVN